MKRWSHLHTFAAGALGALAVARSGWLIAVALVAVFAAGIAVGRLLYRAAQFGAWTLRAGRAVVELRESRLELSRARALEARSRAENAEWVAAEQKRRAERAAGITSSEIAQLQMGRRS